MTSSSLAVSQRAGASSMENLGFGRCFRLRGCFSINRDNKFKSIFLIENIVPDNAFSFVLVRDVCNVGLRNARAESRFLRVWSVAESELSTRDNCFLVVFMLLSIVWSLVEEMCVSRYAKFLCFDLAKKAEKIFMDFFNCLAINNVVCFFE